MVSMDAFQEYLLRGAYILSSCLIVFSLLMYNGLMSSNPNHRGDSFIVAVANHLDSSVQNIWYDTALTAEAVGYNFDKLCLGAIRSSTNGLGRLFAATGNILAAVPEVLTTPPYAHARSD